MDRLGCGDVVVAHDGSIDAGMLICVPRGSVVQSMGRRRLGRRGSCSALRDQCVIIRGVEQLLLSDSPVSGMVLATHEGAQQECNRPDQLRQCRDHCYSDLGFLLPVITSPPSRQAMVFGHCPVTSSQRNRSPAGIQVSRGGAVEAALSSHCGTVISGTDVRRVLSQTPVTWTPPA